MSGVISFGARNDPARMWFCSGWGFRALLDAVSEKNREDEELVRALWQARYHNGLHLELVREESPALARRMREALEAVARETHEAKPHLSVKGRMLGPDEVNMYQAAVAELMEILRKDVED